MRNRFFISLPLVIIFTIFALESYASEHIDADSVGYYIEDLTTGEVLASTNADLTFIPASVTKIVSASSLLLNRSPLDKFVTTVTLQGTKKDSIFYGDIVINASGDATIDSRFYENNNGFIDSIINRLDEQKIKTVSGAIKIETPDCFSNKAPKGWLEEDFVWPYGAVLHGFNYSDNEFSLDISSKKSSPEVPNIKVIRTKSRVGPKVFMKRNSSTITLNRRAQKRGKLTLANPNPEGTLINLLRKKCNDRGIDIRENGIAYDINIDIDTLYTHYSPAFRDIIGVTLRRSHNLMAESLLHAAFPDKTREEAIAMELKNWSNQGINTKNIHIEDGSGLSRGNRISPRFLAEILRHMSESEYSDLFVNSLPISSINGTMRNFTKTAHLHGRLALKTGSMRNVQCFAGYYLDEFGNPSHIVVVLLNGLNTSRENIKKQVENLVLHYLY